MSQPMVPPMMLAVGLAASVLTWWFVLRRGCSGNRPLAVALDAMPVLAGFALLLLATDRPGVSGLVIAALAAGLFLADLTKRDVLHEPVVFADRSELLEVARHPQLYLPFIAGPALIAGILAVVLAMLAVLLWLEPPLWHRTWPVAAISATVAPLVALAAFKLPGRSHGVLRRLATFYATHLQPTREPAADIAALGPLTCLLVHATLAADERPARRQAAARHAMPAAPPAGPVVLVQAESFFDPGRLDPALRAVLPVYEHLRATAARQGRLAVPAWGANTVRTEFAVLSGLREAALGLDCFNPYDAFATAPGPDIPSLARAMRDAGRHTVFVHPFDLSFYDRRRVLPRLGFDQLVGPEAFTTAARRGSYVADAALAEVAAALLRRHGSRVFIVIATMEAHGPWDGAAHKEVPLPQRFRGLPGETALARWLWHLQGTDLMLGALRQALSVHADGSGEPGWLALYGDHQPSIPDLFDALGFADRRTDHLIWHAGRHASGIAQDLAAHTLAGALLEAMHSTVTA